MSKPSVPIAHPTYALELTSHSAEQTLQIGQSLGRLLQRGDLILLVGDLGVGKTQLIKGIVAGTGSADLVTSPSFVLVNEYQAGEQGQGMPIYHADLYRIDTPAELAGTGLPEIWDQQALCLIEWAERATGWLPTGHLTIQMSYRDASMRVLRFLPQAERYHRLIEAFQEPQHSLPPG